MIPASKRAWFSAWLAHHAERRLAKAFERVEVAGLDAVADLTRTRPLLFVANHSAWWDPMMVLVLSQRHLGLDGHALMDAAQLQRFRFFALVGGFGVELDDPRDGARVVRYAASLLDRPGRAVWMFPQGEERPLHEPLAFRGGAAHIARLASNAAVIPLALSYAFGPAARPCAYAAFGAPLDVRLRGARAIEAQQRAVAGQIDRIRAHLSERDAAFAPLLRTPASRIHAWASAALDRFAGRLLDQTTGTHPQLTLPPDHASASEGPHECSQQ
jgi:1-acyl-sn-glycerol-3-phosphate acyltransferase